MEQYIDFKIHNNLEIPSSFILNKLFAKLHLALVDQASGDIGVSFPEAEKTFGGVLRLHGTGTALQELLDKNWHRSMSDYVTVTELLDVPRDCKYQSLRRIQVKSNVGRLLRRSVKKGWISQEEAIERLDNQSDVRSNLPFIQVKSHSTNQSFKLFIKIGNPVADPIKGKFNSFGLSQTATVPYF